MTGAVVASTPWRLALEKRNDMIEWVDCLAGVLLKSRDWHARQQSRHDLHPAVVALMERGYVPDNWHDLVLQWPHPSKQQPGMLAFTPDEVKARLDRVTVTKPARYLTKHFPSVPGNIIRDLVAYAADGNSFELLTNTADIVHAVNTGPGSCMRWDDDDYSETGGKHPYQVYDPALGWGLAIRRNGEGRIDGRALVFEGTDVDGNPHKCFVRSFKRCLCPDTGVEQYSHSDEALEAWLIGEGYVSNDGWPRVEVKRIRLNDGYVLMPYLDGSHARIAEYDGNLVIVSSGGTVADNTDGTMSLEPIDTCYHCDAEVAQADGVYLRLHSSRFVCDRCCSNYYITAYSRNQEQDYVHLDRVVEGTDGESYDERYLDDNDMVRLEDGRVAPEDDTFFCPVRDERYHDEDGLVTQDAGMVHCDYTWRDVDGELWSDNTDSVHINDDAYAECDERICQLADDTWALKSDCWLDNGEWRLLEPETEPAPPVEVALIDVQPAFNLEAA
jgi:hypothetical protein